MHIPLTTNMIMKLLFASTFRLTLLTFSVLCFTALPAEETAEEKEKQIQERIEASKREREESLRKIEEREKRMKNRILSEKDLFARARRPFVRIIARSEMERLAGALHELKKKLPKFPDPASTSIMSNPNPGVSYTKYWLKDNMTTEYMGISTTMSHTAYVPKANRVGLGPYYGNSIHITITVCSFDEDFYSGTPVFYDRASYTTIEFAVVEYGPDYTEEDKKVINKFLDDYIRKERLELRDIKIPTGS
jgi:hypothetical protein